MSRNQAVAQRLDESQALATGLGWFSIALGVAELVAPRALAGAIGIPASAPVLQVFGLREIGTGLGILTSSDPTAWVWGRVGGDALDLATLATGLTENNPQRQNVGLALAAALAVTAVDVACATALSGRDRLHRRDGAAQAYATRSGFPASPEMMRGAARDFKVPDDLRPPKLMRAYIGDRPATPEPRVSAR
jgi:hypothetical protein